MGTAGLGSVQRYILDGSDADLRRLLSIAATLEDAAREAFTAVGVQEGWRAVECGCGPVGALPVLSDMVGASGQVLGVDHVESTVDRARSVIRELGLDNVQVRVGDVNSSDFRDVVGSPVDVAFTRCFLMHQHDLTETIIRIAEVVRAGGWIISHEPMRSPAPRSHPRHDALEAYWELLHRVMESDGAPSRTVDDLPAAARAAGLTVVSLNGFVQMLDPALGFDLHAATAAAAKDRAVQRGIATEAEIDELAGALRAAAPKDYEWVSTPFYLSLRARK
jgi:SAM-dependent methyltransferase